MTTLELANKMVEKDLCTSAEEILPVIKFHLKNKGEDSLSDAAVLEVLVSLGIDYEDITNILEEIIRIRCNSEFEQAKKAILNILTGEKVSTEAEVQTATETPEKKSSKATINLSDFLKEDEQAWVQAQFKKMREHGIKLWKLKPIYKEMQEKDGIALKLRREEAIKPFKEEYDEIKCSYIALIAQDKNLRPLFEHKLAAMM